MLEVLERRGRVDAQLLGEDGAGPLEGAKGVGLATGAVEGEHLQFGQSLTERMLTNQRLQFAHDLAMAPERQFALDAVFDRHHPKLIQRYDLRR